MMWKELIYIGLLTALIAFLEIHFFPNATHLKNLTTVYSLLGFIIIYNKPVKSKYTFGAIKLNLYVETTRIC